MVVSASAHSDVEAALKLAGAGAAFRDELCELIDGVRLFSGLAWQDVAALAGYIVALEADAGYVLFREGEPGDALYVLVRGQVETAKENGSGGQIVIANDAAGKLIGEMALMDGEPRSATCTALQASTLLCLKRERLERLAQANPALAYKLVFRIAQLLSRRLRVASGRLVEYLDH